jgi:hypothetical protein
MSRHYPSSDLQHDLVYTLMRTHAYAVHVTLPTKAGYIDGVQSSKFLIACYTMRYIGRTANFTHFLSNTELDEIQS